MNQFIRPRGKESTEIQKSQIKGKESENSYQELKRSHKHTETVSRYYISVQFPCVCVCLSFGDLFNSW